MTTVRRATSYDAQAIARVHVESWRTTYRGLLPDDYIQARLSVERRAAGWSRTPLEAERGEGVVYVAEDESSGVVGFANGGSERTGEHGHEGELYAIYLLQESQGRGLGSALVSAVAGDLEARGFGSMLVWVLAGNPSRRFYEALGGRLVASKPIEIGGVTLEEVAYGWADAGALAEPKGSGSLEG